MALIPCPECEHNVSTKAPACPHCGCPLGALEAEVNSPQSRASAADDRTERIKQDLQKFKSGFTRFPDIGTIMKQKLEEAEDLLVTVCGQDRHRSLLTAAERVEELQNAYIAEVSKGGNIREAHRDWEAAAESLQRRISGIEYRN